MIEVADLLVQRDGRAVLAIDHLRIERGEVLAVLGPNGAGKTTLASCPGAAAGARATGG